MTTRWDVEDAAKAAEMAAPSLLLLLLLATFCDSKTAMVPAKYSPSLTELVRMSGLARSTVAVHLNHLERGGWLVRRRPTRKDAQTKHARTRYALTVPKLVRPSNGSSPGSEPGLVRPSAKASPGAVHRDKPQPESSRAHARTDEDEVLQMIIETVREATGKTIDREFAERNARRIREASDRPVRSLAYYQTVIRNDPSAYIPTPEPPRFRAPARS